MASAITSGASAQSLLIAEGAQIGQGGILLKGSLVCAEGASITTNGDAVFGAPVGVGSSLFISEAPLPAVGAQQAWRLVVPAAGAEEGQLGLVGWDYTVSPPTQKEVLRVSAAPRVGGAVNNCILNFTAPSQSGTATVLAAATTVVVPAPGLTAGGLVLITCNTPGIAAQTKPPCVTAAANQFTITLQAVPAVDAVFSWFVAKA
jgi:hypothetical protein